MRNTVCLLRFSFAIPPVIVSLAITLFGCVTPLRAEDLSGELPRIEATDPQDTLDAFTVAPGFKIELIASEPLVTSPVEIQWDANGRLFVCEMRGYSEDRDKGISRITLLEDSNDDGLYDKSTIFADSLMWPTGIFPYDGGLFVGDAPNLYYFKDTDGDSVADVKKLVFTGFGTSNVQGLLNSFRWGLDNRIHVACSSVGGEIRREHEPHSKSINVRGRDLSFDPRTFERRLTSGGAQHGMSFDDWGRKFASSNSDHIQQIMYEDRYISRNPLFRVPSSRASIAADGPQAEVFRTSPIEPWRVVRTRLRVSGAVPGVVEGGGRAAGYFTGATGVTIYRGDAWASSEKGIAIIGDVGSNLIHRKRLDTTGIEIVANRIDDHCELVSSSDIWFRPAQFANAPDGALVVVDVCREVIEHPHSLPPSIKQHLDLTAGRDRGRLYRIVPDGFTHRITPRLGAVGTNDLVALLAHPNAWHRETASRRLFERQDRSTIEPLRKLAASSDSPLGRMHAMYALDGLGELDEASVLARFDDDHPQVRRHAVLLAEKLPISDSLVNALTRLADDESVNVRYQLAFTMGSVEGVDTGAIATKLILRDPDDRWMHTAVQSSLGQGAGDAFSRLLDTPEFRSPEFRSPGAAEFLRRLAAQIGQQNRELEIRQSIAVLPKLPLTDAAFALPVIGELLKSRTSKGSVLNELSRTGELQQLDTMIDEMVKASIETALREDPDLSKRVAAIRVLSFGAWPDVQGTLVGLIDQREPYQVQQTAITTLGKFRSRDVAKPLLEAFRGLSPQLRETACEVLFARSERIGSLLDAVDSGLIAISDIPRSRLQIAAKSSDKKIAARLNKLLDSGVTQARQEVIDAYRGVLEMAGDFDRGRIHFRKHCSACHKVENHGFEIGPNLATIKTRGPETILVNVLDPNREVNPQYLNYLLLTEDGRAITGMLAAENASSVTLRRAESATDTVLRVDIDRLQSTGMSIMPESLEDVIDQSAMADIIAYLMQVN